MLTSNQSQKIFAAAVHSENTSTDNGTMAWKHWCRLCAKEDESNLVIFPKITEPGSIIDNTMATDIGKFFWVNIRPNDEISKFLCLECHTLVSSLTQFAERVNKVQAMFCSLLTKNSSNAIDLNEVKLQYGLLDMEWKHIIKLERAVEEKQINYNKTSVHECGWESEKNDIKEEENEFLSNEHSFELINRGLKRKRDVLSYNDGDEYIIPIGAIIGESVDDSEEHNLFEKNTSEENTEQEKNKAKEERKENETIEENKGNLRDVIDLYGSNIECTGGEQSNNDMFDIKVNEKTDRDSEEDTNDNSQTTFKYECNICHKKYKNPTSYRKHILEKHNTQPDIPDFKCEICNKIYPTERQLQLHTRSHLSHEDKLDVPCPYCDRKFTRVSLMNQHVQGVHENKKPYVFEECGVCGKAFKTKARLKVHLETHSGSSFICTECGLSLNTRRTLKMHMLVHSDAKRYICDLCPAAFKRSKALKNHLILHIGMQPYKCNFCGKSFSNGSNCRSHKKKKHAQELAVEEAMGKKTEAISVPKLEELRSSKNIVENPRMVLRHHVGLPLHKRQSLNVAEEREKRSETTKQKNEVYLDENIESFGEETQTHSKVESGIKQETDGDAELIELQEDMVEDDKDNAVTVVYELNAEI